MANSIPSPWILDYLTSVAEHYGADLSGVPHKEKSAKSQLVRFLTFPPAGSNEPCAIWVEISDKKHHIRGRLTVSAIRHYLNNPMHTGKSITSHKSAFALLKKVRVAFGRVARRDAPGMTEESTLFLDVDEFALKGAYGEATWGSPVDVSVDPNIREWIHGLRQDGGAGNVLKLRKQQATALTTEGEEKAKKAKTTAAESHLQSKLNVKVPVARKTVPPRLKAETNGQRPVADKEALRRVSWKALAQHPTMALFSRPPDPIFEELMTLWGQLASLATEQTAEQVKTSPDLVTRSGTPAAVNSVPENPPSISRIAERRARTAIRPSSPSPRSPSCWSESIRNSSPCNDAEESSEEPDPNDLLENHDVTMNDATALEPDPTDNRYSTFETRDDDDIADHPEGHSTNFPPPSQARRDMDPPPSSIPYATSPLRPSPSQISLPGPHVNHDDDVLPPSSFPASDNFLYPSLASIAARPSTPPPLNAPTVRRVPFPRVFPLQRDPDASGEGRVLVENSDTASPGSQSQSQSQNRNRYQSQGQSQLTQEGSQEHAQTQSQSQRASNLRNEVVISERATPYEDGEAGDDDGGAGSQARASPQSQKSRQSLSYKGDSQSQEKTGDVPTGATAPGNEEEHVRSPSAEAGNVGEDQAEVDSDRDDPHAAEPSWEAIKTVSSSVEEDAGDNQNERSDEDELVSDTAEESRDQLRAMRRRVKGKRRIDSDDERTAAMVDGFLAQAGSSKARGDPHASADVHVQAQERPAAKRPRSSTPSDTHKRPVKRPKRGGGTPDADNDNRRTSFSSSLVKTPGGPPLLNWNDLSEILLETGRARNEVKILKLKLEEGASSISHT